MNKKHLLSAAIIFSSLTASAQDASKTYAITGDKDGSYLWMNIRQVDIAKGKTEKDIYKRDVTPFVLLDAATKKEITPAQNYPSAPTASMVAAAAYDKKHGKLFFTPMRIDELRWVETGANADAQKYYSVKGFSGSNLMDEANHFTRMVINADGFGYAISNDGNHLIQFSTGKKTAITDLGNLIDADENKGISVHNKCSSWGGDMVADAYNKLYVISASHNVFVVDVNTRIATYKGAITGLPGNYTTNGAAVDADGKIVVSTATGFSGYYKFDIADLQATMIEGSDNINASDLANGNLLLQKESDAARSFGAAVLPKIAPAAEGRVFPNPVTANEFKVSFDGFDAGVYTIALTDLSGRAIMNKTVNVFAKTQTETVRVSSAIAKGMYLVKVTDANKKNVVTERIVIQ
jgi:Secretion system C-terminal sorting domain